MREYLCEPTLDSGELIEAFSTGEASPVEVAEETLNRIERIDRRVHAFNALDEEGFRKAAQEAETRWAQWRRSASSETDWATAPLWGLPFSVKDSIEQAGLPTTYGSRAFAQNEQPDAAVVQKLRGEGVALIGKTATSEFALSTVTATRLGPATRNPWDLDRTAGGSSGGAAAAAALGLGTVAIGTDSAGSIRLPASYCGVYGLKPTHGLVPIRQRWRASPIRSHIGPLGRTLSDIAVGLRALTGKAYDPRAEALAEQPVRLAGLKADPEFEHIKCEWAGALQRSQGFLWSEAGVVLPELPGATDRSGNWIFAGDHLAAAENLVPDFMARHRDDLMPYTLSIYDVGSEVAAWEYRQALDRFEQYAEQAQRVFDDVDVVITSATGPAPLLPEDESTVGMGERYETLSIWNYSGNPALVIPVGFDREGLPRAIQLVGRRHGELQLLACAARLQQAGAVPRRLLPRVDGPARGAAHRATRDPDIER